MDVFLLLTIYLALYMLRRQLFLESVKWVNVFRTHFTEEASEVYEDAVPSSKSHS